IDSNDSTHGVPFAASDTLECLEPPADLLVHRSELPGALQVLARLRCVAGLAADVAGELPETDVVLVERDGALDVERRLQRLEAEREQELGELVGEFRVGRTELRRFFE